VAALVHCIVPGKSLAQVGMETYFVATATLSTKRNWTEGGCEGLGHKREIRAGSVGAHCCIGGLVVPRLAHHIAEAARQEIGAKDNELLVIEMHKAGIQENGLFYVLE
jgi:hypothetical protein